MSLTETPHLLLPYIAPSQAQKHVTHNEALRLVDALVQLSVISRLTTPPISPSDGARYIVLPAATGVFAGQVGKIATFVDSQWLFAMPEEGWLAYSIADGRQFVYRAASWQDHIGTAVSGAPLAKIGVNANADATNKLSVKSDAVLFSHDDVTPGTGDARLNLNKSLPAKTTSLVFQTGFSGRAEMGLGGDDDFRVKVSQDGATWFDALIIGRSTGRVSMPLTPQRDVLTSARIYYVRTDGNDSNTGLADNAAGAFRNIQRALSAVYGGLDLNGFNVTIQVRNGTYSEALSVTSPQVGAGNVTLQGNISTPASVIVSSGGATSILVKGAGSKLFVAGIKVTNTGFAGWHADAGGSILSSGKNEVGAVGSHQLIAEGPSTIYMVHEMVISGGCAGAHILASNNGYIYLQGASWTIAGSPTFGAFANAGGGGCIYTFLNTFTGTIVGQRYNVSLNGIIQTNTGGNVNHFPGSVAGGVASGGQYA